MKTNTWMPTITIILSCAAMTFAGGTHAAPDNWGWEPHPKGRPCPMSPKLEFGEKENRTDLSHPNCLRREEKAKVKKDKPIFIVMAGICDGGKRQTQAETLQGFRQMRLEGVNDAYPPDGEDSVFSTEFEEGWNLGQEMPRALLNMPPVNGEAVFYYVPWSC